MAPGAGIRTAKTHYRSGEVVEVQFNVKADVVLAGDGTPARAGITCG